MVSDLFAPRAGHQCPIDNVSPPPIDWGGTGDWGLTGTGIALVSRTGNKIERFLVIYFDLQPINRYIKLLH